MAMDPVEADYVIWRRYVEMSGDRAMVARLEAMQAVEQAGKATIALPDGGETRVPLIMAAEAAAAALNGESEAKWRLDWTRRLVRLAVKWQDEATTQGVATILSYTDSVIRDLKEAGVWRWAPQSSEEA